MGSHAMEQEAMKERKDPAKGHVESGESCTYVEQAMKCQAKNTFWILLLYRANYTYWVFFGA